MTFQNQRAALDLNDIWEFFPDGRPAGVIDVPDFWDAHPAYADVAQAVYERDVAVPDGPEWRAGSIRLEFEGVNYAAEVFVDGVPAGSHVGGFIPWSVDVTRLVKPGGSCRLKVAVKGGRLPPVVDGEGRPLMPIGFHGHKQMWGIVFGVRLAAYGAVGARDVYVRPSVRKRRLAVTVELANASDRARTVRVNLKAIPVCGPSASALSFGSGDAAVGPLASVAVEIEADWPDPRLWWPSAPALYRLETEVADVRTGEVIDRRADRFGFREIWTEGNRLLLNGVKLTLLGANIVQHCEFFDTQRRQFMTPETWHRTIDRLFALNLRTVRFHMQPAPGFILDAADERGLLVMEEAPIYSRDYMQQVDIPVYLGHCLEWIGPWVRDRRNHPSVIVWNAENEMGFAELSCMTREQLKSLGDEIRRHDATRPVNYDGDGDVGDALVNLHYPEKYMATVSGSIYAWASLVRPDKPTGVGEFLTHYGPDGNANQWWQGTWVRGLRYSGFADIRPYRHDWAIFRPDDTPCSHNLRNSLAPVALFDKEYDDLGIAPLVNRAYPALESGTTVTRTLVLYNDEYAGDAVEVEVLVRSSRMYQALYEYSGDRAPWPEIAAQGRETFVVPPGERIEIACSFAVPPLVEGFRDSCDVELVARKDGAVRFRETKRFCLAHKDFRGETSRRVRLEKA